jgi:hypothetical protein
MQKPGIEENAGLRPTGFCPLSPADGGEGAKSRSPFTVRATSATTLLPPLHSGALPRARVSPWHWVWPVLLVAHFFLPYVPGTRYRVEVFTLLLGFLFPLARSRPNAQEGDLVFFTALCGFWSLLRVGMQPSPQGIPATAILWINLNFPLIATSFYLLLKGRLLQHRRWLVKAVLMVGIANNLIALLQCYRPDWTWHPWIYSNYGGTISADYDDVLTQHSTAVMSNAEFLAKLGGRYTGILVSSHMLSVFNVWLIGTSYALYRDRKATSADQWLAIGSVLLALMGGVLSGGKMFYMGVGVMFCALLLVRRQFGLVVWGGFAGVAMFVIAPLLFPEESEVRNAINRVLSGDMMRILGSRYSTEGYLADTIERLTTDRSLQLYGTGADLGTLIVADSLFLLPLAAGGVPLLLLYIWPIVWLMMRLWKRSNEPNEYVPVMFGVHASFLVSGIGVPVYQMGRIAPLLWIVTLAFAFAPSELVAKRTALPQPVPRGLPVRPKLSVVKGT